MKYKVTLDWWIVPFSRYINSKNNLKKGCLQEYAKKWIAITAGTLLFCYYFSHLDQSYQVHRTFFLRLDLPRLQCIQGVGWAIVFDPFSSFSDSWNTKLVINCVIQTLKLVWSQFLSLKELTLCQEVDFYEAIFSLLIFKKKILLHFWSFL